MMIEEVNYADAPAEIPTVNLGDPETAGMPNELAKVRAQRAVFALPELNKNYEDYYNDFLGGREREARQQAAVSLDSLNANKFRNWLATPGRKPLDTAQKFNKLSDPNSVFEDNYAREYLNYFYKSDKQDSEFVDATREAPQYMRGLLDAGSDIVSRQEFIRTGLENAQEALKNQSTFGSVVDFAKGLLQTYNEAKLRGGAGVSIFDGLLGTNLEKQRQAYMNMPYDQFKQEFTANLQRLIQTNPNLAVVYANAMMGISSEEIGMTNLFTALTVVEGASAVKALSGVAKTSATFGAVYSAQRQARQAVQQAVAANAGTTPRQLSMPLSVRLPAATGNLRQAGIAQTANQASAVFEGTADPTSIALNALTDNLRITQSAIEANPGNYGTEVMNRITEQFNGALTNMVSAILETARVQRIGTVLASDTVVREVEREIRNKYPGLSGNVINMLPIRYEPVTNTFSIDTILVKNDGAYFANVREANKFARDNDIYVSHIEGQRVKNTLVRSPGGVRPTGPLRVGDQVNIEINGVLYNKTPVKITDIQTDSAGKRWYQTEGSTTYVNETSIKDLRPNIPKGSFTGQVQDIPITVRGASINQNGDGYYLAVNRPITETDHAIRDALITTEKSQNVNKGWFNSLGLGWFRTPDDVISLQERINRKLSIYGPAMMKYILEQNNIPVNQVLRKYKYKNLDLSQGVIKAVWDRFKNGSEFERMLQATDNMVVNKERGYNFQNPAELEYFYRMNFARSPDPIEVEAYFAKVRGMDMDLAFRDMAMFKSMHRWGAEQHIVSALDAQGRMIASPEFAGRFQSELPGGNGRILVMRDDGQHTVHWTNDLMKSKFGKEINEGMARGEWKVVRLYNSDINPFETMAPVSAGKRIEYVASRDIQTRPLNFNQVPKRGGGHLEYDYDWYIKQGKVIHDDGKHTYIGDTTLMPIDNRLMGKDLVKILENVREHLAAGDVAGAKAANTSSIPWDDLYARFNPTYRGGVKIAAQLDAFEPFYVVPKNKTILDLPNHYEKQYTGNFIDGTRSGNPARQFQVQFTGARDAYDVMTIQNEGTRGNPLFSYRPAKTIDPLTSMNRALTNIINSTFMDDMKISAMEHWLMKHESNLDASPEEIRSAPFYHFSNTEFKKGVDRSVWSAAEAHRYQIKQFNGIPSKIDALLDDWESKLADSVYGSDNALTKTAWTLGKYSLATTRKAPAFLRSVAFKADIGLFSLPQLLVQSNTYFTIYGISGPVKATQGSVGALLHQYSRINSSPEILNALDKVAQKFGWKPGEWLEAREHLNASGFSYVGKETNAFMADIGNNKIVKTAWGNFLDAGDIFFKAGERHSRFGAWYTAWKEQNLTASASLADRANILERADLLGGNMTSASKSILQSGVLAFPAQFMGYIMRVGEQFLGKRLSKVEKARLLATYATVYGVPVAAGLSTLPLGYMIKQSALANGYIPHQNALSTTLMEGVPEMLTHYMTGTSHNFGERFGSPGLEIWQDLLKGDKKWWEIMMGASGNLLGNTLSNMSPFYKTMVSWGRDENPFKITSSDMIQPFREIASVNATARLMAALNSKVWETKNETPLVRDVSPLHAVIMTATGLSPLAANRDQLYKDAIDAQESLEKKALSDFIRDFRRGLGELRQTPPNPEQAQAYFKNADATLAISHYPITKRAAAFAIALNDQTLPERMRWQYFMKDVPSDVELERAKQFGIATKQGM